VAQVRACAGEKTVIAYILLCAYDYHPQKTWDTDVLKHYFGINIELKKLVDAHGFVK
jgi:hypothetical protein